MSKKAVKIGVRIVDRPMLAKPAPNQPYQPPKKQYFKAIATCNIAGKRFSRTAAAETEDGSRREAYSKLATLIAKQGAVPVEKYGVEISPSKQDNGQNASES